MRSLPRISVCALASGLAALCVAMLTATPASAVNGTPTWFNSFVGSAAPSQYVSSPSLAFDHYGVPSVSWSSTSPVSATNTVYRSNTSGLGFWSHSVVESGPGVGLLTSLSFDRAERPTVAWMNDSGEIRTLFNNSVAQVVAGNGNIPRPALSIHHDLTGTLRGGYSGTTVGNIFSLTGSNGSHASNSIGTLPNISQILDLRFTTDHTGRSHAIVRASLTTNTQAVIVASEPIGAGPWVSSVLATADDVKGVAITTSPADGQVALAYTTFNAGTNTSKLFYAKSTGTSLQTTEVQSSATAMFEDIDLAFDFSDGRPAIAYERKTLAPFAQQIQFAYLNASSLWQTSLVDGTASLDNPMGLPRRPSLAFDDYGTSWPAVAYVDADGSLTVAFDPPASAPEPGTVLLIALAAGGAHFRRRHR